MRLSSPYPNVETTLKLKRRAYRPSLREGSQWHCREGALVPLGTRCLMHTVELANIGHCTCENARDYAHTRRITSRCLHERNNHCRQTRSTRRRSSSRAVVNSSPKHPITSDIKSASLSTLPDLPSAKDKTLFTPGPLTTSLPVKQAMLRDAGSWHF